MTARMSATTIVALLRRSSAKCELRSILQVVGTRPTATSTTTTHITPRNPHHQPHHLRSLHTTPIWLRKKTREEKEQARLRTADDGATADEPKSQHPTPTPEEALDFADVHSRLAKHAEHAQESLKKLKAGGRFNPDLIGSVKVVPDRKQDAAASYPLRELASVVPKGGRTISILVHEAAHVKPILSAVQAHPDFNQQPQRSPDNDLELLLKVEPESREDLARRVKALCNDWRERVRDVRHRRDKLHVTWRKDGALLPDAKRKADAELEKVIKAELTKIYSAEKEATKAAESK